MRTTAVRRGARALVAVAGAFATFVVFAWRDEHEELIPADTVARSDRAHRAGRASLLGMGAAR